MDNGVISTKRVDRGDAHDAWRTFARIGLVTKGILYAVVGGLAIQTAVGTGGQTTGSKGAMLTILQQPFGQVLLGLVGLGLVAYALFRIVQALFDPEGRGTDAKAAAKRVGFFVSGLIHGGLAVWAAMVLFGNGGGGGGKQAWTAKLLATSYGPWLVGAAGIIVIGFAIYTVVRAIRCSFMERLDTARMPRRQVTWARRLGRLGLSARSVVFALMGVFLVQAALTYDASQARGLGGALATIARQSWGSWLLGLVAIGLVAYAVYCFARARYEEFATTA